MTRLTVLALDMCITLSQMLADQTLRETEVEESARKPVIVMQDETESRDMEGPLCSMQYFESSMSSVSAALKDLKAVRFRSEAILCTAGADVRGVRYLTLCHVVPPISGMFIAIPWR